MDLPIPLRDPDDIHRSESFQDAVRRAAPLREAWESTREQRLSALRRILPGLEGPTIVTSVFDGRYLPFLRNWFASCRAHGVDPRPRTLLFPTDAAANRGATDLGFETLYEGEIAPLEPASDDSARMTIALRKLGIVSDLLEQGRDILFQDLDVVWLRDPLDSVRRLAGHDALDALFLHDGPDARFSPKHYDSGFFFLRNNAFTRAAWCHVMDRWPAVVHLGSDKAYLNQLLPSLEARGLRVAALEEDRFVGGHVLVDAEAHYRSIPADPELVHVSRTLGPEAKIDKMKRLGHWYLDAGSPSSSAEGRS